MDASVLTDVRELHCARTHDCRNFRAHRWLNSHGDCGSIVFRGVYDDSVNRACGVHNNFPTYRRD